MALQIDTSVNILGHLTVPGIYLRMFYSHDIPGNRIHVSVEPFLDKQSFMNGRENLLDVPGVPYQLDFDYDRATDGVDTLMFAHQKIQEYMSTDKMQEVAATDASGNVLTDPSTGETIWVEEIVEPKFTEIGNINIIDI